MFLSNRLTRSITDPPDSPSIFGYQESSSIRAGTLQRLTCVVHGGNPLPDLKWYTGEEEVKAGATPSINGNVVSNELALVTKDSDNGATYRCEASSAATGDKPLIASIKLTVHCEYLATCSQRGTCRPSFLS